MRKKVCGVLMAPYTVLKKDVNTFFLSMRNLRSNFGLTLILILVDAFLQEVISNEQKRNKQINKKLEKITVTISFRFQLN